MKRFFATLLVLSILASVAYAEWNEIIKVVAYDQNNYPVANVPVTIKYQRNNFLGLETVPEIETVGTGGTGYIDCSVLPEGEDCPSLADYGVGEALIPVLTETSLENVEPSEVTVQITRFDLSDADGEITGKTGAEGTFEAEIRDFVPEANATKEYLVTVGTEQRRVSHNQNLIDGRHVEFFRTNDAQSLVPLQVVDFEGTPLAQVEVDVPCWAGKEILTNAEGKATVYPRPGSCKMTAFYGIFNVTNTVNVAAEKIVLLTINKDGNNFTLSAKTAPGKAINDSSLVVRLNDVELDFSDAGVAPVPDEIKYGKLATAFIKWQNKSILQGLYMLNGTARVVMAMNGLVTLKIPDYNNTLEVVVVDENGLPIGDALVMLKSGESGQTGPDGSISFAEIYEPGANVSVVVNGVNKSIFVQFQGRTPASATIEFRRNPLEIVLLSVNHSYAKGCNMILKVAAIDPRMKNAADISASLYYGFDTATLTEKKLGVTGNGSVKEISIPCPLKLPATFVYELRASDKYDNFTSRRMSYVVPSAPALASVGQVFDKAVAVTAEVTGSESLALLIVTIVLLVFIVIISVSALTVIMNRGKLKRITKGGKEEEPELPEI
ncbi:MAG: hypothetical protein Q7T16_03020 [Candidatus Burarchaeum sp.]|nr:hypothetical protein [Candidatus Burarchaeum sp.]MDO8339606.1 hypothetical protein [Candidatus Burarchaeum sp.]